MRKKIELETFSSRIPPALKEWLREQAEQNFRSMNDELIACIVSSKQSRERRHEHA